jgi:hypothetical protein
MLEHDVNTACQQHMLELESPKNVYAEEELVRNIRSILTAVGEGWTEPIPKEL